MLEIGLKCIRKFLLLIRERVEESDINMSDKNLYVAWSLGYTENILLNPHPKQC
jgi:hypothetical protein